MKWFIDNWSLLVIIAAVVVFIWHYCKRFAGLPSEAQIKKVKEWLLYAVIEAEKELGSGTGKLKLRYVYDKFVERFPTLVSVVPFEAFSKWVDEALEEMKHLLDTNKDIEAYVEGDWS